MRNRWLLLAAVACACATRKPDDKPAPAASVSKKTSDADVAKLTLTPAAEARLGLTVVAAESKSVARSRTVGGDVVPPSGRALAVVAPVGGTVNAVGKEMLRAGASVHRGDALLRLTPVAAVDRDVRSQSERAITAAEARLSAAEARVSRTEKLLDAGSASEKSLEEAKADRDVQRAERDAARARGQMLDRAPLEADVAVTLRAPEDGVVRQVSVGPGGMVAAGAPLFEIVGTDAAWLKVSVFAGDLREIRADAAARVRPLTAPPDAAEIEALPVHGPPTADPQSVTFDLYYALPRASDFHPGERVAVTLSYAAATARVVVPWSAIVHDATGGSLVYAAVSEHVYERRRVEVERVVAQEAVIARGLDAGARVVATGAAELWALELGNAK